MNSRPSCSAPAGVALAAALALTAAGSAFAAPFTQGDLVVLRLGTGAAPLTSAGTAEFLDEYTTTGTLVQTIALPTAASGSNLPIVDSGTAGSDGALTLSQNGAYLTLGGYNAAPGTASISSAAGINRGVAVIDAGGNVDTSTSLPEGTTATSTYNLNNLRSVASTDGTTFFLGGTSSTAVTAGVRTTTIGGTASTQVESTTLNTRVVNIANSNLYFSTGSATGNSGIGIYQVGSGISTAGGQATSLVVATGTKSSPYDFVFTNPNTLYVTDDLSVSGTTNASLTEYVNSGSGFTSAATFNLPALTTGNAGLRGLTGTSTDLYGISTDNRLVDFNLASGLFSTLVTAPTNEGFRGVDLSPAPEPGEFAVLSLVGLGLGAALLRRRLKTAGVAAV